MLSPLKRTWGLSHEIDFMVVYRFDHSISPHDDLWVSCLIIL